MWRAEHKCADKRTSADQSRKTAGWNNHCIVNCRHLTARPSFCPASSKSSIVRSCDASVLPDCVGYLQLPDVYKGEVYDQGNETLDICDSPGYLHGLSSIRPNLRINCGRGEGREAGGDPGCDGYCSQYIDQREPHYPN